MTIIRISSPTNGMTSAEANGQPTMPPMPNHIMPEAVLKPPRQSMNDANPSMVQYMAKLEGRYATDAWNIPAAVTEMTKKTMPILGLITREITANSWVSQRAQTRPKKIRKK